MDSRATKTVLNAIGWYLTNHGFSGRKFRKHDLDPVFCCIDDRALFIRQQIRFSFKQEVAELSSLFLSQEVSVLIKSGISKILAWNSWLTWKTHHQLTQHGCLLLCRLCYSYFRLKRGGGFVHKSARKEKVLRTSTIIYSLIDIDELSIFCHRTWSPERFLEKFWPLNLWRYYIRFHHFTLTQSQLSNELKNAVYAASIALETRYKTVLKNGLNMLCWGTCPSEYSSGYRVTHPRHL